MAETYRRRRRRRRAVPAVPLLLGLVLVCLTAAVLWVLLRDRGPEAKDIPVPDYVERDYLTVNEWSRPGTELAEINGVVIHYVGNPGTTAEQNRSYFQSLAETGATSASSNLIVGLDGEALLCVPLDEVAYCSNSRNDDTVSIEFCHPDDSGEPDDQTYYTLVRLTAWLCGLYGLDPQTDVIRHYDVIGKECPKYYVDDPDAWAQFKSDVDLAMR